MRDEIAAIAERELGAPPDRVSRPAEGLLHETYELEVEDAAYVLQFASDVDDDRADSLERGLGCYVLLQDSEIPVPEVVTERVRNHDGRRYTLVEQLPGTTGERDISPDRTRNAGRYLARIHGVRRFDAAGWLRVDGDGLSADAFEEGSLERRVHRDVREAANVLRERGMETAGSELARVFDEVGEDLPESFQPVLCHDDYTPDNLLFDGDEVTGIVDFDRAVASHAHRDLAKAANAFWMHDPCADWDVREAFYEGYRAVADPGPSLERVEPLYRAETLAGTVAGLLELDECSEYEREFYGERILDAIERI